MDYQSRRKKLMKDTKLDAIALVPGANLTYFTGLHFHLSERPLVAFLTDKKLYFIVPQLEVSIIQQNIDADAEYFVWTDKDGYQGAFQQAVEKLNLTEAILGVDEMTMRVFELLTFMDIAPDIQIKKLGKTLLMHRVQKTEEEIDRMSTAIQISEKALEDLLKWVKAGMTEREIATMLDSLLTENGAQGFAFNSLVQVGVNSANPHGGLTDTELQRGEFLLIDFGGKYQDYPADITRTFCIGEPSEEMQKIYDTVVAANQAAQKAVKPGATWASVDKAARDVIEQAGYGEYFIHRTGHGLGLEVHELPQIAEGETDELLPGMVFTIEPGIYVKGLGGVRIEDNIVVTETGGESLTSFPRQLQIGG